MKRIDEWRLFSERFIYGERLAPEELKIARTAGNSS